MPRRAKTTNGGYTVRPVKKPGNRATLHPIDDWPQEFLEVLGSCPDEIERPKQELLSKMPNPFE